MKNHRSRPETTVLYCDIMYFITNYKAIVYAKISILEVYFFIGIMNKRTGKAINLSTTNN